MPQTTKQPQVTDDGIRFTVCVDYEYRECLISKEALLKLSRLKPDVSDPMETFQAFEATINGVARRMVAARVQGSPMQLGPNSFYATN